MAHAKLIEGHLKEALSDGFYRHVRLRTTELGGQARAVADYIVANWEHVNDMAVTTIAKEVAVSDSTVRRVFDFLGLKNSNGSLIDDDGLDPVCLGEGIQKTFNYTSSATRIIAGLYDTVHDLQHQQEQIVQAAQVLTEAGFVHVYGAVVSAGIGIMFQEGLTALGIPSRHSSDTDATVRSLQPLAPNSAIFCVSLLGSTAHMGLRVLATAKKQNIKSVVLTNYRTSGAAKLADVVLTTGVTDPKLDYRSLGVRSSQLLVLDILLEEMRRQMDRRLR